MSLFDERLESLNWKDFPFRIDVLPDVFAAQKRIAGPLTRQLRTGNIVLIEGGPGTGKTHVLRWLHQFAEGSQGVIPCSISEPLNTQILSTALTALLVRTTGDKIPSPPTLIDHLLDRVEKFFKAKHKRIVLLFDDGDALALREGETEEIEAEKRKTIRWLRALSDLPAVIVFMAGLNGFKEALTNLFEPFSDRITLHLQLEQPGRTGPEVLTRIETKELIQKRIAFVGGSGIVPFTEEAIDAIHLHTRGFPRTILRFCENLLEYAFQEDTPAGDRITRDFIQQVAQLHPCPPPESTPIPVITTSERFIEESPEESEDGWFEEFDELTAIQRDILNLVKQFQKATSAVVAEELGIAKGTASNELKKLYDMRKVQRRKGYRGFEYLPK
ncbi:MAG: AAA family ATPase [Promethearchaeota archaeon]